MDIVMKPITDIHLNPKNPRKNDVAVGFVANSIREFGFKQPIVVNEDGMILAGNTRYKAAVSLGLSEVPVLVASDLDEVKQRAFILADNKTAEIAEWDKDLLKAELIDLEDYDINMPDFGFEPVDFSAVGTKDDDDDGFYGDERLRTDNAYNLSIVDQSNLTENWEMPIIWNDGYVPEEMIAFKYAMQSKRHDVGVHFYIDDYQFERVWNNPEGYVNLLSQFDCILAPNFSMYYDMPKPMKIWNTFRSRLIGSYYQQMGMKVIPSVVWNGTDTWDFAFEGIEKGSVVCVSTISIKKGAFLEDLKAGMAEMIRRIEPSFIMIYGGAIDYDFGDIPVKYYDANTWLSDYNHNKGKKGKSADEDVAFD